MLKCENAFFSLGLFFIAFFCESFDFSQLIFSDIFQLLTAPRVPHSSAKFMEIIFSALFILGGCCGRIVRGRGWAEAEDEDAPR